MSKITLLLRVGILFALIFGNTCELCWRKFGGKCLKSCPNPLKILDAECSEGKKCCDYSEVSCEADGGECKKDWCGSPHIPMLDGYCPNNMVCCELFQISCGGGWGRCLKSDICYSNVSDSYCPRDLVCCENEKDK